MKRIAIMIACHKPSELPKNKLYVPIHVGAAISKINMEGIQRDDEGDNISDKNLSYCEMTAQYWAWKNLDSDYYGLCHYRRYLCFSDKKFDNISKDGREQVISHILSPYTMKKYGIEDEKKTREIIEENDIVIAYDQDYRNVSTPYGYKNNIYDHYAAHHGAIINIKDIDIMLELIKKMYPDISEFAINYMKKNGKFLGFNTFVMKKDIYFKMCEFEFSILKQMEKLIDFTYYNQQLTRVYGYIGELLSSIFISYTISRNSNIKVKRLQMVYFEKTDPIKKILPIENAVPLFIHLEGVPEFLQEISIKSLLNTISKEKKYDIICGSGKMSPFLKSYFKKECDQFDNVNIRFFDYEVERAKLLEIGLNIADIPMEVCLPWILEEYKKILFVKWNSYFYSSPDKIFENREKTAIIANKNIVQQAMLNDVYPYERKRLEKLNIVNGFELFDDHIMIMNLDVCREIIGTYSSLLKIYDEFKVKNETVDESIFLNTIYKNNISELNQMWGCFLPGNEAEENIIKRAPFDLFNEYNRGKKEIKIAKFNGDMLWFGSDKKIYIDCWKVIRNSDIYPMFVAHLIDRRAILLQENKSNKIPVMQKILPYGSKRREMIKKVIKKLRK